VSHCGPGLRYLASWTKPCPVSSLINNKGWSTAWQGALGLILEWDAGLRGWGRRRGCGYRCHYHQTWDQSSSFYFTQRRGRRVRRDGLVPRGVQSAGALHPVPGLWPSEVIWKRGVPLSEQQGAQKGPLILLVPSSFLPNASSPLPGNPGLKKGAGDNCATAHQGDAQGKGAGTAVNPQKGDWKRMEEEDSGFSGWCSCYRCPVCARWADLPTWSLGCTGWPPACAGYTCVPGNRGPGSPLCWLSCLPSPGRSGAGLKGPGGRFQASSSSRPSRPLTSTSRCSTVFSTIWEEGGIHEHSQLLLCGPHPMSALWALHPVECSEERTGCCRIQVLHISFAALPPGGISAK
jgi:hypothetical protein